MIIGAVVILMTASAFFTAAAMVQVHSHPHERIPHFGSMKPVTSLWLFLGGMLAVAAGAFLYSRSQGMNSIGEYVVFLLAAVTPLVVVRLLHNRNPARTRRLIDDERPSLPGEQPGATRDA